MFYMFALEMRKQVQRLYKVLKISNGQIWVQNLSQNDPRPSTGIYSLEDTFRRISLDLLNSSGSVSWVAVWYNAES